MSVPDLGNVISANNYRTKKQHILIAIRRLEKQTSATRALLYWVGTHNGLRASTRGGVVNGCKYPKPSVDDEIRELGASYRRQTTACCA